MALQIVRNDITKVRADAIVNTANPRVAVGDGVDTAIYNAAGYEQLLEERKKIGELPAGEVCVTPAFDLDAKYIIHVSGPRWKGGDKGEEQLLRRCYDKALEMAAEKGCESIAFPLMSTGSYKFPKKLGMEIAVAAFTEFLLDNEMEITLVVFGSEATDIDSFAEAKRFGIRKDRTVNYVHDGVGTGTVFAGVSKAMCAVMAAPRAADVDECLSDSGWDTEITEDFVRRGRR